MNKILLSTVAVATLATVSTASTHSDIRALKAQIVKMTQKITELESKQAETAKVIESEKKASIVKSKAPILKFSGTHYLGFVSDKVGASDGSKINKFETRRNYLQVKAYFKDNPKDYMRVTLDTHQDSTGDWKLRVKYSYLYLNNILPYTGVEIGQAHRPWIDYEEHHGWLYRSISKTFIEGTPDLVNSSDLGLNFKTKTDYFSSELGIFNGSGYHGIKDGNGLSGEWRLTAHLIGTGKKHVHKHDTYADISFFGQYGTNGIKNSDSNGDYRWYGVHAVYNQERFLISTQYLKADKAKDSKKGKGWSVNGEFRPTEDISIFTKYDDFTLDNNTKKKRTIAGVAYQYNKNVEFIANYLKDKVDSSTVSDKIMLTAEVNW